MLQQLSTADDSYCRRTTAQNLSTTSSVTSLTPVHVQLLQLLQPCQLRQALLRQLRPVALSCCSWPIAPKKAVLIKSTAQLSNLRRHGHRMPKCLRWFRLGKSAVASASAISCTFFSARQCFILPF